MKSRTKMLRRNSMLSMLLGIIVFGAGILLASLLLSVSKDVLPKQDFFTVLFLIFTGIFFLTLSYFYRLQFYKESQK